jgi:hypothetical protein
MAALSEQPQGHPISHPHPCKPSPAAQEYLRQGGAAKKIFAMQLDQQASLNRLRPRSTEMYRDQQSLEL